VSARVPGTDDILVRCRPLQDPGVSFTTPDDILRVGLDATNDDLPPSHRLPGEFAIHTALYRARADIGAVVHGHPRASLLCGVLGLPLSPVIGAYDPAAMDIAVKGVARFPRAVLISTPSLAADLVRAMGTSNAALLIGHGVVTAGDEIVEATIRAVKLETLCDLILTAHMARPGGAPPLAPADVEGVADFVDRSGAVKTFARWTWDHYARSLAAVHSGPDMED
jgi:ribulose-5-phosphate 4-epimerase/fuculose-1-phosphate aldolase